MACGISCCLTFLPEEGKYHMEGHRACGVRLNPKETISLGGVCPVCGGRITVGVAHRMELLADRTEAEASPPSTSTKRMPWRMLASSDRRKHTAYQ